MGVIYNKKDRYYTLKGKYKNEYGEWKDYERSTPEHRFKKKTDAAKADEELRKSLSKKSKISSVGALTFESVMDIYFKEQEGQMKSTTIYTDQKALKKAKVLFDMQIKLITPTTIQDIINDLDKENYSLNYISKIYTTVGKIFKFAIKKKFIYNTPMEDVTMIKRADVIVDDTALCWTPEEFSTFISNVDDFHDYVLFNFLYHTGCRKGEALALNWSDLDLNKKTFRINKTCSQGLPNIPFLLTPPKTPNSFRTKRMPDKLNIIMKKWYKDQSNKYGFNKNCFVFGSLDKPYPTSTLERHFKKYRSFGDGWVSANQLQHAIPTDHDNFRIDDLVLVIDGNIKNNAIGYRTIKNYKKVLLIDAVSSNPLDPFPFHVKMPFSSITIHGFRHSHATLLINNIKNGANIKAIADRLGDTVPEVLKTYAHLFHETENELIDIIEKNT